VLHIRQDDILPVHYDPKERKYIVDHQYLTAELGARIVKMRRTIKPGAGYEMNTIEFAVKDGVPYAIDFLNPAPDFERDPHYGIYFEHVVEKMARLVIDRALNGKASNPWPRWEEMIGIGAAADLRERQGALPGAEVRGRSGRRVGARIVMK